MTKEIQAEDYSVFHEDYQRKLGETVSANAAMRQGPKEASRSQDAERALTPNYSIELEAGDVTNQKHSGRCWMFSGLNVLRMNVMKNLKLKNMELSQNYLMFYDKLEKSNAFLEYILETRDQEDDSREVLFLFSGCSSDGGYWEYFRNLVDKYGVLPKEFMPETYSSSNSDQMDDLLQAKLSEEACVLRRHAKEGKSLEELEQEKAEMMKVNYRILSVCLGEPPHSFTYEVRDTDKKFIRLENITPLEFFKKYADVPVDDYLSIIHDPEENKSYGKSYTVKFCNNVIGKEGVRYLNLPIERLKELAIASLKDGHALWFACDVLKCSDRKDGLLSKSLFEYDKLISSPLFSDGFQMSKAEQMKYHESVPNHAMTLVGVDLDADGKPTKWRVENSWGKDVGKDGFFVMDDAWFDEFVYQIVVDKKYLKPEELAAYEKEPTLLPAWDPLCSSLD